MSIKEKYKRARRNFLKRYRRMVRKGYTTDIPVPKIPKRATEGSIRALNRVWERMKEKSVYLNRLTGELESYKARERDRRQEAARVGAYKRKVKLALESYKKADGSYDLPTMDIIIISNFRREVIDRYPAVAAPIIERFLNEAIEKYGSKAVADMLQEAKQDGIYLSNHEAYDEEKVLLYTKRILEYLKVDDSKGMKELLSALEEYEEAEDYEI